jgi:DNA-binding winged helix-turn-helix (wHTH) protein
MTFDVLEVAVNASTSVPPTLRFGVFELDPRVGELRKQGMKIRLQGQPVEILAMLLERPGEIVSREELQKKIWPGETNWDAVIRVYEQIGNVIEFPLILTLRESPIQVA